MAKTITTLEQILSFSAEDLAANRAGAITDTQYQRLERRRRNTWRLFIIAAILFVLIGIASVVADVPTAALIFGGLGVALLSGIYWIVRRQSQHLRTVPLAARQGEITLEDVRRRRTGAPAAVDYKLTVEGTTFTIDRHLHAWLQAALAQGESTYTVYYLAEQNRILSMEPGLVPLDAFAESGRVQSPLPTGSIGRAIAVLESRRPPASAEEATTARAQALEELRAVGPEVVYSLAAHLHKPVYRELVAQFGARAVVPLMRLIGREGALIESPLVESVINVLNKMPLKVVQDKLPPYLERHHSPSVRMVALRVLSHRRNPDRIFILQRTAQDPEPAIAARAQHTLARLDEFYGWK